MSMNATEDVVSSSATLRATVDFPEPDPPAIPMMRGFSIPFESYKSGNWNALCLFGGHTIRCVLRQAQMKTRLIAFAFLLAGIPGCNVYRHSSDTVQNQPTVVQVDNQGFLDMTVYAARSSERIRLGIATGNSKTNFNIPSVLMSGLTPLHFVADPIGGRRASVSQEITVAPGDTVVLTIPPV